MKDHIEKVYFEDAEAKRQETLNELDRFINNASLVIRVIYGDKKILLAGDVYNTYWKNLIGASIFTGAVRQYPGKSAEIAPSRTSGQHLRGIYQCGCT